MTPLQSLIWKEWLGLRWKMAALSAIPAAWLVTAVVYERSMPFGYCYAAIGSYLALAPIFLAMHAAAVERCDGALDFVRSLPVGRRQLGLVRIVATLVGLIVPLIFTSALADLLASLFSHASLQAQIEFARGQDEFVAWAAVSLGIAASLYLWTTAIAMNQASELNAGAIGVGVLVASGAIALTVFSHYRDPQAWQPLVLVGPTALGWILLALPMVAIPLRIAVFVGQLLVCGVLIKIAAERYAQLEPRASGAPRPFLRQSHALIWAQRRQIVPLAILGLMVICLLSLPEEVSGAVVVTIGIAWAIVSGVTVFAADLDPRLIAFWRSRPIDPGLWFGVKYAIGGLALIGFFDLPALIPVRGLQSLGGLWVYLTFMPFLHLAVYSAAVAIACVVRNSIYAGILSMGASLAIAGVPILRHDQAVLSSIEDFLSIRASAAPAPAATSAATSLPGPVHVRALVPAFSASATGPPFMHVLPYLVLLILVGALTTWAAWWAIRRDVAVRL